MKFLVTLGLLSCVAVLGQAAPHCHLSELWSCVEIAVDWFHSLPKRSLAETEADVEVFCNEMNKVADCAFGYRDNCTTPLQKELIGLTMEGTIALYKDFCTPGSDTRTKYLANAVCYNKVFKMDEFKDQVLYAMAWLEKAQDVENNQFIKYICCGDNKISNTLVKLGSEHCGDDAMKSLLDTFAMSYAQIPEVLCGAWTGEEDECTEILPPSGSKPTDRLKELEIYKFVHHLLKDWLD